MAAQGLTPSVQRDVCDVARRNICTYGAAARRRSCYGVLQAIADRAAGGQSRKDVNSRRPGAFSGFLGISSARVGSRRQSNAGRCVRAGIKMGNGSCQCEAHHTVADTPSKAPSHGSYAADWSASGVAPQPTRRMEKVISRNFIRTTHNTCVVAGGEWSPTSVPDLKNDDCEKEKRDRRQEQQERYLFALVHRVALGKACGKTGRRDRPGHALSNRSASAGKFAPRMSAEPIAP